MPLKSVSNPKSGSSQNLKVTVLLGGHSPERKISLKSGRAVSEALTKAGFAVRTLDPARERVEDLNPEETDTVFIALHGLGGEDGSLQGILERKKIPYVGSGPRGCRLSFDKWLTKKTLEKKGLPVPRGTLIRAANWEKRLAGVTPPSFCQTCQGRLEPRRFLCGELTKSGSHDKKSPRKIRRIAGRGKNNGPGIYRGNSGGQASSRHRACAEKRFL